MSKFLQFELWKNCNVGCKFCFNRYQPTSDTKYKLIALDNMLNVLQSDEVEDFDELGFIGGEFFSGQIDTEEVRSKFYQGIDIVIDRMKQDKVYKFYIATSLIYDLNTEFNYFLQKFIDAKVLKRLMISTSYDIEGRFKTHREEQLWQMNMIGLHEKYPMLPIHTQIVLSQNFIRHILDNSFNIEEFCKKYYTFVDYNIPHIGYDYRDKEEFNKLIPDFLPKRDDFLKFLYKTVIEDKTVDIDKLFDYKTKADVMYLIYINTIYRIVNKNYKTLLPFGLYDKAGYADSDIKIWEDVAKFKEELDE